MSGLLVVCKQCLTEYEPSHDDIMRGYSWWSLCPECRTATRTKRDKTQPAEASQGRRTRRYLAVDLDRLLRWLDCRPDVLPARGKE